MTTTEQGRRESALDALRAQVKTASAAALQATAELQAATNRLEKTVLRQHGCTAQQLLAIKNAAADPISGPYRPGLPGVLRGQQSALKNGFLQYNSDKLRSVQRNGTTTNTWLVLTPKAVCMLKDLYGPDWHYNEP